jgi:hypothetical protein
MIQANVGLLWRVPEAGHAWVSATLVPLGGTEPVNLVRGTPTTARVLVPNLGTWREYHPLRDEPELFRRFAELEFPAEVEACEDTVRRFADRYGALDFGSLVALPWDPGADTREGLCEMADGSIWRFRRGAGLGTWYRAHHLLRRAVMVWDALQAGDTLTLARWFPWEAREEVHEGAFVPDEPEPATVDTPPVQLFSERLGERSWPLAGWNPDPSDHWPGWPSGPVQWAMLHLHGWVNEQLGLHAKLRLRWAPSTPEKMPLRLGVVPETLLGGMWWQLAQAIDGGLRYERCAFCGQWFHVKPRGNRQNTRFCRTYCRVKANRRGHQQRPKKKAAAR